MPLYIKDDATADLVAELVRRRRISKQEAIRQAVAAELARMEDAVPLRDRFARLRQEHPLLRRPARARTSREGFVDLRRRRLRDDRDHPWRG